MAEQKTITIGVLALQGAFEEHLRLLHEASLEIANHVNWIFIEVRTAADLERCDALIIPGGESTTMALVAARNGLLDPLRDFVKYVHHMRGIKIHHERSKDSSINKGSASPGMGHLCGPDLASGVSKSDQTRRTRPPRRS